MECEIGVAAKGGEVEAKGAPEAEGSIVAKEVVVVVIVGAIEGIGRGAAAKGETRLLEGGASRTKLGTRIPDEDDDDVAVVSRSEGTGGVVTNGRAVGDASSRLEARAAAVCVTAVAALVAVAASAAAFFDSFSRSQLSKARLKECETESVMA